MFSNVWVQKGGADARDFGPASQPWPEDDERTGRFFPSLLLKNDTTLIVLASVLAHGSGDSSRTVVRWIEGTIK